MLHSLVSAVRLAWSFVWENIEACMLAFVLGMTALAWFGSHVLSWLP